MGSWITGRWWGEGSRPDGEGTQYILLIRDPEDDPERSSRPDGGRDDRFPHLTVRKTSEEEWREAILQLLSDGEPRTFNRIGVELIDKTADVLGGTPVEGALWSLVADGVVEHEIAAPVHFRGAS